MRILYLIKDFNFGGAENHVMDLANSMAESNNEVFLVTRKGLQSNRLSKMVKLIPMRMNDLFTPFQVLFICFIIAKHRIEIIHAHKRLAIFQASFAGKIMRVPVIATVHGRTRHDLRSWFSRKMVSRIIFVSGRTFEANQHLEIYRNKSVLIHNSVRINPDCKEKDQLSIVYVCRIDKKHASVISMIIEKVLPELTASFPGLTFNVIGDGKFLNVLRNEAEYLNRKNGHEICRFHGYVPDVKPVICRSGIVLGVGRVALEALSGSVPVISLNRLFLGNLISRENYEFYRFNNFVAIGHDGPDPERLKGLLTDYLTNPDYWHKEAKEIRRSVEENLNLEKISSDILVLYRNTSQSVKIKSGNRY